MAIISSLTAQLLESDDGCDLKFNNAFACAASLVCFIVKLFLSVFCFLIINLLPSVSHARQTPLFLIITNDVLRDYEKFLDGRNPLEISDYSGCYSRRDVVEVVFLQQALEKGGFDAEISFSTADTYLRTLEEVIAGRAYLTANTVWLKDIKENQETLQESPAIIRPGEFQVGLYVSSGMLQTLKRDGYPDIERLTAVSNRNWRADWQLLNELGVSRVIHIQKWTSMVRMVDAGRADFLLSPFHHTPGMVLDVDGRVLYPIPGIKVSLDGSRHFAVSKRYSNWLALENALERGIEIMRKQGLILAAYEQAGFFNSAVKDWRLLNSPKQLPTGSGN